VKYVLLGLTLVLCVVTAGIYKSDTVQAKDLNIMQDKYKVEKEMSDSNVITIELETGTVTLEPYPDVAPKTVESFKKLISNGFYDGLIFHRIIPGFMAQGGDPDGTGMGGPGFSLKAEFNDKKHVRGTLAMARSSDPDSAGSQFYICYGPQPHLDGQYTIFGQVTEGMELIDDLKNGAVMKKLSIVESGE
jgi:peptidylprolyl isomerase/peptidyl-prolyl cis-trans isomerase B (cyclophilin B)